MIPTNAWHPPMHSPTLSLPSSPVARTLSDELIANDHGEPMPSCGEQVGRMGRDGATALSAAMPLPPARLLPRDWER